MQTNEPLIWELFTSFLKSSGKPSGISFSCLIWLALISCFCFHSIILPLKSKKPKKCEILNSVGTFSLNYNDFLKLLLGVHCYMIPVPFCNDGSWKGQFVPNMILVNRFSELRQDFKTAEPWGTNVDIGQQGSLIMMRFKNRNNKKQLREQCAFDDNNSTVNSFPLQNDKSRWYLTNIQCIHKYSSSLMTCLSIKSMQSLVLRCVHFTVHCCHLAACPPPP